METLARASMCYWFPRVREAGVRMPLTRLVRADHPALLGLLDGNPLPEAVWRDIQAAAEAVGYPLVLRTDMAAAKHDWARGPFVASPDVLHDHLCVVVSANASADLVMSGVALREYLPLDARFAAFPGQLPIAPEWRYFVEGGSIRCRHPYWPVEAIERAELVHPHDVAPWLPKPRRLANGDLVRAGSTLPDDWRERLAATHELSDDDSDTLDHMAMRVGRLLDGAWSVDFARMEGGGWALLDAAPAEVSWHPDC